MFGTSESQKINKSSLFYINFVLFNYLLRCICLFGHYDFFFFSFFLLFDCYIFLLIFTPKTKEKQLKSSKSTKMEPVGLESILQMLQT